MDIIDSIAGDLAAESPDEPSSMGEGLSEADFSADLEYQQRALMLEQALREAGALPPLEGTRPERPYDEDLRKLIMSVAIE